MLKFELKHELAKWRFSKKKNRAIIQNTYTEHTHTHIQHLYTQRKLRTNSFFRLLLHTHTQSHIFIHTSYIHKQWHTRKIDFAVFSKPKYAKLLHSLSPPLFFVCNIFFKFKEKSNQKTTIKNQQQQQQNHLHCSIFPDRSPQAIPCLLYYTVVRISSSNPPNNYV